VTKGFNYFGNNINNTNKTEAAKNGLWENTKSSEDGFSDEGEFAAEGA
jgi:hypothetical protein